MKMFTSIVAVALVTLGAGRASAQADRPLTESVSYADLDLAKPSGRAALDQRVARAVDHVCPDEPGPLRLARRREQIECREQALTDAKLQIAAAVAPSRPGARVLFAVGPTRR